MAVLAVRISEGKYDRAALEKQVRRCPTGPQSAATGLGRGSAPGRWGVPPNGLRIREH